MFLSKQQILNQFESLVGKEGDKKHVQEVCYDLCVGDEVYRSEDQLPVNLSDEAPYVILHPGQFALIKTYETVIVPGENVGLISIRSEYKFQGLVNVSGFHVDPTFNGHLLFSVQNVGPNDIRLRYRQPTFMMMWAVLEQKYVPSATDKKREGYPNIPMHLMAQLGGRGITLTQLKAEVDQLHTQVKFFSGLAAALAVALIGVILRLVLHS